MMRHLLAVAASVMFAVWAASAAQAGEQNCGEASCYRTVTTRHVVGYRTKEVPVYRYHHHKVRVPCCGPKPAQAAIKPPPPKTVTLPQQVFVHIVPQIHYIYPQLHVLPPPPCPPPPCDHCTWRQGWRGDPPAPQRTVLLGPTGYHGCLAEHRPGEIYQCGDHSPSGYCVCH